MKRPDAKKLMNDIAEVYKKSVEQVAEYWKESGEKKTIENGRERILAAEPAEKRSDTIHTFQMNTIAEVDGLKEKWLADEKAFFALRGEDITDDMKLLNDVVNPTVDQLRDLAVKYFEKNAVMEQSILNFAKTHGEKYSIIFKMPHTQTTADRESIIDVFDVKMLRSAYLNTTSKPDEDNAFSYNNAYLPILNKAYEKIRDNADSAM